MKIELLFQYVATKSTKLGQIIGLYMSILYKYLSLCLFIPYQHLHTNKWKNIILANVRCCDDFCYSDEMNQ